ncbi:hypothetical protein IMZ08_06280 [Bacillus luteolus]|uniref:Uncharacterized protein n=1 Tax=Litchfieldia luteola TaxID=682179 RepID=A0ABR9QGN6_9BACI|nr:YppG family protein [Cytobacillus luteolus]MBE4907658.1 hypothetical protein [Cytobacillus luteolus]MBP1941109.1 hypothetical protein [Cytobacillus luteolus]
MFPPRQVPLRRGAVGNPLNRHPFLGQAVPRPRPQRVPFAAPLGRPPRQIGPSTGQRRDLLSYFRKEDGTYDFQKMTATAGQIKGVYNQVAGFAPMITKLLGR